MAKKYLNNKDLLKQIHISKNTYCSFSDKKYSDFDIIVNSVENIVGSLEEGKRLRSSRLSLIDYEKSQQKGEKSKPDQFYIDESPISDQDVVFRVMTWVFPTLLRSITSMPASRNIGASFFGELALVVTKGTCSSMATRA